MCAQEDEGGITLEEQIKILQEEKLPPEKIVEKILEEDMNADINTLAETLQMDKLAIGRIKGRLSRLKKRAAEKEKSSEAAKGTPPEGLYKTEPDTNVILEEILKTHPDVPEKIKDEVMDWAKRRGSLDPGFVAWLLSSMRGVTTTTANIVSQKYALALQKAQQEGKLPPGVFPMYPATQQGQFPMFYPLFQQPGQPQPSPAATMSGQLGPPSPINQSMYGYGYGPQAPLTVQDVQRIFREELRLMEERKPKESVSEQFVDIYEPVKNEEGQVIVDENNRPIMRHMHVPVSQATQFTPKEDPEARFLQKMKDYKDLFGSKEELTEGKIRTIVREESPQPATVEKPVTLEDVQRASSEAATAAVKQVTDEREREKKEDERFRRLEDTIMSTASAKTVEGYKDDSFRILGQGLSEVAGATKDRKPIEIIVKEGGRLLFPGGPGEKLVEPGAGEGILKRLRDRGWVTEQ